MDNKETYLLVMKSVFSARFKIHKKYDLKGSTVDRQASSKEKVNYLTSVTNVSAVALEQLAKERWKIIYTECIVLREQLVLFS